MCESIFSIIDKVERFPISFVIKSEENPYVLKGKLQEYAMVQYDVASVVQRYMDCIEELINLPELRQRLAIAVERGHLRAMLDDIVLQSQIEFNF